MARKTHSKELKLSNHVGVFYRSLQKSEAWVGDMHEYLMWLDADGVYHLLRAVLQALRDHMDTNEAAHFAAQLPLILRGTFFESWNPVTMPQKARTKDEFLAQIKDHLGPKSQLNFDLEVGVIVAIRVVMNHISRGEMADIIATFSPSLKEFFEKIDSLALQEISLNLGGGYDSVSDNFSQFSGI